MINKEDLAEFYIDNKNVLIISLFVYSAYIMLISFIFNFIKIDSDGFLFFVLSIFTALFTIYIIYVLYHLLLGKIYYDKFNKNQREKILEKELELLKDKKADVKNAIKIKEREINDIILTQEQK